MYNPLSYKTFDMDEAEKKTKSVMVMLSPSQLEELDAWRFSQHIGSRSDAVRRLLLPALAEEIRKTTATADRGLSKSQRSPARARRGG